MLRYKGEARLEQCMCLLFPCSDVQQCFGMWERKLVPTSLSLSHSSLLLDNLRTFVFLTATKESLAFWRRGHELLCLSRSEVWGVVFELLLSAALLGVLIRALCKVVAPAQGCEWVGSLGEHSCSCLWGLAGLGMDTKGSKAHAIMGCSPVFKALLFPGLAPFPVGIPLRHECNALLIQHSTKLKSWSWKSHMPNKQLCWQGADKPWTQATRSRFSSASRQRFVWQGMLASYRTCSVVCMKVLSVLAVLFPLAGY